MSNKEWVIIGMFEGDGQLKNGELGDEGWEKKLFREKIDAIWWETVPLSTPSCVHQLIFPRIENILGSGQVMF